MDKIIATVGPSLLHTVKLTEVHTDKNIYRINGAHGTIEDIENYILAIKDQVKDAKILMDLPGNKVRTANFQYGFIELEEEKEFSMKFHQMNYKEFFKHLRVGDEVWANDSIFKFIVKSINVEFGEIVFISKSNGKLLNNKGMHVRGIHENIPFLFDKDRQLIKLANKHNIDYVGLSFVRHEKDIQEVKKLIENSIIISKVETLSAVNNLDKILDEVEYILVDRGDLSTEVGLLNVPEYQQRIIKKSNEKNIKVFLATQFLKSMEFNPIPTMPEVIDMHNTIKDGIYGIQMSEETAVGKYPKECLDTINNISNNIKGQNE
jgi:pyruvate kinase